MLLFPMAYLVSHHAEVVIKLEFRPLQPCFS